VDVNNFLMRATEHILAAAITGLVLGTSLAFGGAVWWAPIAIGGLALLVTLACLARMLLEGRMRVFKSPLTLLGVGAVGLAAVQLAPLPPALAARLSPNAQAAYSRGVLPALATADDPTAALPEPAPVRSPATLDRPATLRWLFGSMACLALFWAVAHYADRLGRLYLVWGLIIAAFFLNTAFALVQVGCGASGLYGLYQAGKGPFWAPSNTDLLTTPNTSVLRTPAVRASAPAALAAVVPDRPFLFGSLMGGAGAYLALGSLGMPLALAVILQLVAPRGSREGLRTRLADSGQGSLVVLLCGLLLASAVLVGLLAGPLASVPFALGVALAGLPAAWPTGLRWTAVTLTIVVLLCLAGGAVAGGAWSRLGPDTAPPPVASVDLAAARRVWADCLAIVKDFPVIGTGMGSFAAVNPFYKTRDAATTTALSSVLQWWVESGAVGLSLVMAAIAWCLFRLPAGVRQVGTADRALVFGLIGAAASFSLFSAVHWTVELTAIALAASAWAGTWNRWLAGGTDLFVERG
jgi:hypothetical protein